MLEIILPFILNLCALDMVEHYVVGDVVLMAKLFVLPQLATEVMGVGAQETFVEEVIIASSECRSLSTGREPHLGLLSPPRLSLRLGLKGEFNLWFGQELVVGILKILLGV